MPQVLDGVPHKCFAFSELKLLQERIDRTGAEALSCSELCLLSLRRGEALRLGGVLHTPNTVVNLRGTL